MKDDYWFRFEMKDNGGFTYENKGLIISFIYPFIMCAGFLMSIISYPLFLIIWLFKSLEAKYNE